MGKVGNHSTAFQEVRSEQFTSGRQNCGGAQGKRTPSEANQTTATNSRPMRESKLDGFIFSVLGFTDIKIPSPDVSIGELRRKFAGSEVQIMRADRVAGLEHLSFAAENAVRAVKQGRGRSKSIAMETLLFTSAQRQISRAVERLGVTPQTREVVMTIFSRQSLNEDEVNALAQSVFGGRRLDGVIEISSGKKIRELCRSYGISSEELAAARLPSERVNSLVKRLILERSALLSTGT